MTAEAPCQGGSLRERTVIWALSTTCTLLIAYDREEVRMKHPNITYRTRDATMRVLRLMIIDDQHFNQPQSLEIHRK
jgi:hypothetical protein